MAAARRGPPGGPPGRARRAGGGDGDRGRRDDLRGAGGGRHPPGRGVLLGYDLAERTRYGLVLTTRVPGTSAIPPEPDPERLRALGAAAARISSVELTRAPALPVRSLRIEAEDFAAMRREQGASDLLRAAEAAVAASRPDHGRLGLVHGDLWLGNTLWDDGRLAAVLDWDCAGVGPAGIDLGSLRCDAAWCYGIEAAWAHPARLGSRGGQPRDRRPLLGRRRPCPPPRRTWAGSRYRWPLQGRLRPDQRGHAQAP